MRKINFIPGERYGRLTVLGENGRTPHGQVMVDCRCDCGTEVNTRGYSLRQGRTQSCGCLQIERATEANITHGHTTGRTKGRQWSSTYLSWTAMISRCTNQSNKRWNDWGGRGITVCPRWRIFENFLEDMGERPKGKTIDRIDNDGNYAPGNCRWATTSEQRLNQRPKKNRRQAARDRMQETFSGVVT